MGQGFIGGAGREGKRCANGRGKKREREREREEQQQRIWWRSNKQHKPHARTGKQIFYISKIQVRVKRGKKGRNGGGLKRGREGGWGERERERERERQSNEIIHKGKVVLQRRRRLLLLVALYYDWTQNCGERERGKKVDWCEVKCTSANDV